MTGLRVVDAGETGALRSQALWHGIAETMTGDSRPTLSFCRPTEPYVGLGYHRSLEELDAESCSRRALAIIRRRIGGGPVYIDDQQLFFQLSLPAAIAPARVDLLYRRFLGPAVEAFRTLGIAAELRGLNDITVEDRKISGTGAGRIGDGVLVVGNVIFGFPHHRMTDALAFPSDSQAAECLRLMRRHVSSLRDEGATGVTFEEAKETLTASYAAELDLTPEAETTTPDEEVAIGGWERRFSDPRWLAGPSTPRRTGSLVKISGDAWVWSTSDAGVSLEASIACGRIERLHVAGRGINGSSQRIAREIAGHSSDPTRVENTLHAHGIEGERIARLLGPGLRLH